MIITKNKSEVGTYDICIQENENKSLVLTWGKNGDLYWILDDLEEIDRKEDPMYDSFCITKEDFALYSVFKDLYDDLMQGRIYLPDKHPNTNVENLTEEEINIVKKFNAESTMRSTQANDEVKKDKRYKKLTADNVVTWYSDEEEASLAEILRISEQEDSILLEFVRQTKKDDQGFYRLPGYYSIRFRTSGSAYTPCDLIFSRHFLKMQEYDFNAPQQIHIEEILYKQKKKQKNRR